MSTSQPVILLIPGAWHQAGCWDSVATLLRNQNYQVVSATLPSAGGPTSSTIADDAEHIRNKYLDDLIAQGREVIVVVHSYGGIPGTESVKGRARKDVAAQGKSGGVIALVYVTAFLIPAGKSLIETLPSNSPSLVNLSYGDATQPNDPRFHFYNDLDDETAAKCMDALVHHSMPAFATPLTYEAYRDVPVSYLFCERDEAILPAFQKQMAAFPGGGAVRTYTCTSGHSPMISMPEKVVDVIQDTAAVVKV